MLLQAETQEILGDTKGVSKELNTNILQIKRTNILLTYLQQLYVRFVRKTISFKVATNSYNKM